MTATIRMILAFIVPIIEAIIILATLITVLVSYKIAVQIRSYSYMLMGLLLCFAYYELISEYFKDEDPSMKLNLIVGIPIFILFIIWVFNTVQVFRKRSNVFYVNKVFFWLYFAVTSIFSFVVLTLDGIMLQQYWKEGGKNEGGQNNGNGGSDESTQPGGGSSGNNIPPGGSNGSSQSNGGASGDKKPLKKKPKDNDGSSKLSDADKLFVHYRIFNPDSRQHSDANQNFRYLQLEIDKSNFKTSVRELGEELIQKHYYRSGNKYIGDDLRTLAGHIWAATDPKIPTIDITMDGWKAIKKSESTFNDPEMQEYIHKKDDGNYHIYILYTLNNTDLRRIILNKKEEPGGKNKFVAFVTVYNDRNLNNPRYVTIPVDDTEASSLVAIANAAMKRISPQGKIDVTSDTWKTKVAYQLWWNKDKEGGKIFMFDETQNAKDARYFVNKPILKLTPRDGIRTYLPAKTTWFVYLNLYISDAVPKDTDAIQ